MLEFVRTWRGGGPSTGGLVRWAAYDCQRDEVDLERREHLPPMGLSVQCTGKG